MGNFSIIAALYCSIMWTAETRTWRCQNFLLSKKKGDIIQSHPKNKAWGNNFIFQHSLFIQKCLKIYFHIGTEINIIHLVGRHQCFFRQMIFKKKPQTLNKTNVRSFRKKREIEHFMIIWSSCSKIKNTQWERKYKATSFSIWRRVVLKKNCF